MGWRTLEQTAGQINYTQTEVWDKAARALKQSVTIRVPPLQACNWHHGLWPTLPFRLH